MTTATCMVLMFIIFMIRYRGILKKNLIMKTLICGILGIAWTIMNLSYTSVKVLAEICVKMLRLVAMSQILFTRKQMTMNGKFGLVTAINKL